MLGALGCSKSPQRVCEHLVDMAERQFGDLDAAMRDQAVKTCVREKTDLEKADEERFHCFAACVLDVRTLAEAADCEPKCGIAPKKHAEEPEPEGVPGLWTDPYADAMDDSRGHGDSRGDAADDTPDGAGEDAREDAGGAAKEHAKAQGGGETAVGAQGKVDANAAE